MILFAIFLLLGMGAAFEICTLNDFDKKFGHFWYILNLCTVLYLENSNLSDIDVEIIVQAVISTKGIKGERLQPPRLASIDLSRNLFGKAGSVALTNLFTYHKHLKSVSVGGNKMLQFEGISLICESISYLPNLEYLYLESLNLTDSSTIDSLSRLIKRNRRALISK